MATLFEKLQAAHKEARMAKNRNNIQVNILGVVIASAENEKSRKKLKVVSDAIVLEQLKKVNKGLTELGTEEARAEARFLEPFLPPMLNEEQIKDILYGYHGEGVRAVKDFMARFNADHKGQADNKLVSQLAQKFTQ